MNKEYDLHSSTFEYIKPDENQVYVMKMVREASQAYAKLIEDLLPSGSDKSYILRQVRQNAMWCNVAITREADGAPRTSKNFEE